MFYGFRGFFNVSFCIFPIGFIEVDLSLFCSVSSNRDPAEALLRWFWSHVCKNCKNMFKPYLFDAQIHQFIFSWPNLPSNTLDFPESVRLFFCMSFKSPSTSGNYLACNCAAKTAPRNYFKINSNWFCWQSGDASLKASNSSPRVLGTYWSHLATAPSRPLWWFVARLQVRLQFGPWWGSRAIRTCFFRGNPCATSQLVWHTSGPLARLISRCFQQVDGVLMASYDKLNIYTKIDRTYTRR